MSPEQNPRSFGRRSFLRASGTVAAGFLAACGGNAGRGGGSTGGKAAISQWYHQYGEAGTQTALTDPDRHAANTLQHQDRVTPKPVTGTVTDGGRPSALLPPMSWNTVTIPLAS
ncbi:hypothetical protein [Streptomyces sp. NPDC050164]|uniref:hypothetical protein n=1 Tax=Streptomyces sp. NPDC050164 TaxID=3365605 RepID=UPI0037B0A24E